MNKKPKKSSFFYRDLEELTGNSVSYDECYTITSTGTSAGKSIFYVRSSKDFTMHEDTNARPNEQVESYLFDQASLISMVASKVPSKESDAPKTRGRLSECGALSLSAEDLSTECIDPSERSMDLSAESTHVAGALQADLPSVSFGPPPPKPPRWGCSHASLQEQVERVQQHVSGLQRGGGRLSLGKLTQEKVCAWRGVLASLQILDHQCSYLQDPEYCTTAKLDSVLCLLRALEISLAVLCSATVSEHGNKSRRGLVRLMSSNFGSFFDRRRTTVNGITDTGPLDDLELIKHVQASLEMCDKTVKCQLEYVRIPSMDLSEQKDMPGKSSEAQLQPGVQGLTLEFGPGNPQCASSGQQLDRGNVACRAEGPEPSPEISCSTPRP